MGVTKEVDQDLKKFKEKLKSQYQLYKDKQIDHPDQDLIEKGKQFYSRLEPDEKDWYKVLNEAWEKRPILPVLKRVKMQSTTTK